MPHLGPCLAWHPALAPGLWLLTLAAAVALVQTVAWLSPPPPPGPRPKLARFAPALAPLSALALGACLWAACGPG